MNIDEIILVGGSSYMPMVKARLQKEFSCPIRLDHIEPDLAVAKGAALHAASIVANSANAKGPSVKIINDMGSRSYGIFCVDNEDKEHIANIIKRTDNLVFEGTSSFSTRHDGQTGIEVKIYENLFVEDRVDDIGSCTLIEKKMLEWGFSVPKGTLMTTHVSRSSDGIVKIWAECQGKRIDFEIKYRGAYSDQEIERRRSILSTKSV